MTLLTILMLCAAGFFAGAVNAVAGGGTFLTFAALVGAGLPTLDANATSAVGLVPANLASTLGYRKEIREAGRAMVPFAIIGAVGGTFGAVLLILIGDEGFRPTVPWLLLTATLLFAFSARIKRAIAPLAQGRDKGAKLFAFGLMMLVAVYGGFFGAGMGIMMLAALAIIESGDFHKANAIKLLVSFLIQAVSAAVLIAGGLVHWPEALVTMAASVVGGYMGIYVARGVPEKYIRAGVVCVGATLTVIFFLRT